MLDKIKMALGFLGALGPQLLKLKGIIDLLGGLIKVNMASKDVDALRAGIAGWYEASNAFRKMLDEVDQVFLSAEAAVAEDGPGGDDITYDEIKEFLAEVKDVPASVVEVGKRLDDVIDSLKKMV